MLPCCIAKCRARARSGAPLVVCAVATGHQLWTWPPLGTGATLSCPVVPAARAVWGWWWHEKHRIDASPARVTLIREVPPKVQTTSPKNGKNGLLWVRWSAIWANPGTRQTRPPTTATFLHRTAAKSRPQQHDVSILRLIGHVVSLGFVPCMPWYALLVRTWTRYPEPGLSHPHVDPLFRVWATPPTYGTDGPRAKQRVHMRDTLEPRSLSHTANP